MTRPEHVWITYISKVDADDKHQHRRRDTYEYVVIPVKHFVKNVYGIHNNKYLLVTLNYI
jgi:hypothetical protein